MKARENFLLAIEGVDAIGKKNQSQLLVDWLAKTGFRSELISFPDYTTHIGREIKAFLRNKRKYSTELQHILFAANRWEKLEQLRAMLTRAQVVVVNRYTESNLAYGKVNGLSIEWLATLEKGLPKADLVILLDAPPSLLASRRATKKDMFEANIEFQDRVRGAYKTLAPHFGWIVIDATGTIQEIHQRIRKILSTRLQSSRSAIT